LKTRTGKLSPKQEEVIAKIRAGGTQVTVARSVEEAVEAVRACFGIIDAPKPEKAATGRPALSEMTYPKLATNLFVANIFGTDYVMEGDSFPGGISKMVRRATTADYGIPRI
jgi:hypothetical protein